MSLIYRCSDLPLPEEAYDGGCQPLLSAHRSIPGPAVFVNQASLSCA
jgi:hypothetical protein